MNTGTIRVDPVATRLRRVGRVARHRMRIDATNLVNGTHTDGTLTVRIDRLVAVDGQAQSFEWSADRPIALVIVRSGVDGENVAFHVGPTESGIARPGDPDDVSGIRYIAFCYDAPRAVATTPAVAPAAMTAAPLAPAAAVHPPLVAGTIAAAHASDVDANGSTGGVSPSRPAIARSFAATLRDRRSILGRLLAVPRVPLERRVPRVRLGSAG